MTLPGIFFTMPSNFYRKIPLKDSLIWRLRIFPAGVFGHRVDVAAVFHFVLFYLPAAQGSRTPMRRMGVRGWCGGSVVFPGAHAFFGSLVPMRRMGTSF
jgi:hypothetical protein